MVIDMGVISLFCIGELVFLASVENAVVSSMYTFTSVKYYMVIAICTNI